MLLISDNLLLEVVEHARDEHPIEACGVIVGKNGVPTRVIEMSNGDESTVSFTFEAREQIHVWREMEERGEELLVVYHSHTASHPVPSTKDTRNARSAGEGVLHLIVSTSSPDTTEMRCYRVLEDESYEEVEIVAQQVEPV